MRSGDGFVVSSSSDPLPLARLQGGFLLIGLNFRPSYIPWAKSTGFSAYADAGNVLVGFSLGNIDQLRILSEPVIGVQGVSLREVASRSSSSMIEGIYDDWGERSDESLVLLRASSLAKIFPCFSSAVKTFEPQVSNLERISRSAIQGNKSASTAAYIEDKSLSE